MQITFASNDKKVVEAYRDASKDLIFRDIELNFLLTDLSSSLAELKFDAVVAPTNSFGFIASYVSKTRQLIAEIQKRNC